MTGLKKTILTSAEGSARAELCITKDVFRTCCKALSIALLLSGFLSRAADLPEIVQKATAAINSDWAADPKYACVEKDETHKNGKVTSKTFQVVMIDGSEYHLQLAVDDQPLSPEQEKAEYAKLKEEVQRRKSESASARERRIAAWKKEHDENGELLLDYPKAFDFQLVREEVKNGHPAYVLAAKPKPGVVATTRAQKVLAGMEGTAWIDKATLHPIHVECNVTRAVPVFGALASVLPGTRIDIGMTPVSDSVWLIDDVAMNLNVAKLKMFKSNEATRSTYTHYRPNEMVLQELLAKAGQP
jgi:outer membrane lipoprotein-sorting protein